MKHKACLSSIMAILAIMLMVPSVKATTCWIQVLQYPIGPEVILERGKKKVAVNLAFTLDDTVFAEIASGGMMTFNGTKVTMRNWIAIDGEVVQHTWRQGSKETPAGLGDALQMWPLDQTFGWIFEPGEHTIELGIYAMSGAEGVASYFSYSRARLEVNFQIEEEESPALSERPPDQIPQPSSVITNAPFLTVEGCQRVFDTSGRAVIADVQDGRIELNRLPAGIFFAETKDGYTVRIVKVK